MGELWEFRTRTAMKISPPLRLQSIRFDVIFSPNNVIFFVSKILKIFLNVCLPDFCMLCENLYSAFQNVSCSLYSGEIIPGFFGRFPKKIFDFFRWTGTKSTLRSIFSERIVDLIVFQFGFCWIDQKKSALSKFYQPFFPQHRFFSWVFWRNIFFLLNLYFFLVFFGKKDENVKV